MSNKAFDTAKRNVYESSKLKFVGVDGYDVYNCSIPFTWDGEKYIFGRVEKRENWADSFAYLFKETAKDQFEIVKDSLVYQLEDPYITFLGDELILGGTHVVKTKGEVDHLYGYFYRGTDIKHLTYFTTGPENMKDIRLVPLAGGKVGVFSRPRSAAISAEYGSESMIGFAIIDRIEDLDAEVIANAKYIYGIFESGQWGGCNQAYLLDDGKVGVIGHISDKMVDASGIEILSYKNISFIFDPETFAADDLKIIATRSDYPEGPAKTPQLVDCAFTSGITFENDGKVNLYSGIGDCEEGRLLIDNPFA